jgi:CxxC motif-containing protein (DUF1111 family)
MKTARLLFAVTALAALVLAWSLGDSASAASRQVAFGRPLEGLSAAELELFLAGLEEFEEEEDEEEGLGPVFNDLGCVSCHSDPAVGGASEINETRAAQSRDGVYYDLPGGSLYQSDAISEKCRERVPSRANVSALRQTTPLFGSGLIEAVPDAQVEAYAAAQAASHPDQAGRIHYVVDVATGQTRVGRFGWKSQQATLLAFSGDAYLNEMGITSVLFPRENAPNGDRGKLAECDDVPDPEDADDAISAFTNFMRLLAPPPRQPETPGADHGRRLFQTVGCDVCHHVGYTAVSPIAAINGKRVDAFSDFLLHDVGTGDGIIQGDAQVNELRTAPLWGLSVSEPYLHDGSARGVVDAILRHGNQGQAAREAFEALSRADQAALLEFLESI